MRFQFGGLLLLFLTTLGLSSSAWARPNAEDIIESMSLPYACAGCHGGGMKPTVTLSGPTALKLNETGTYIFKITGGQNYRGGMYINASGGTLASGTNTKYVAAQNAIIHSSVLNATGTSPNKVLEYSFKFKATTAGSYTLSAFGLSTDGNGSTGDEMDSEAITVMVAAENQPPVARPGGPYSGRIGANIQFNAGASTDPENKPLTYKWTFGDGAMSTLVNPTHAYNEVKSYAAKLEVTDNEGLKHEVSFNVVIKEANDLPVAKAKVSELTPGKRKRLHFYGRESTDSDGTIQSYVWNFGDGTQGYRKSMAHKFPGPGSYNVTLTVTDNDGDTDTDTITVQINSQ